MKHTYCLYTRLKLQVRTKKRKKLTRDRQPLCLPITINVRWSMDFVSDQLSNGTTVVGRLSPRDVYTTCCARGINDALLTNFEVKSDIKIDIARSYVTTAWCEACEFSFFKSYIGIKVQSPNLTIYDSVVNFGTHNPEKTKRSIFLRPSYPSYLKLADLSNYEISSLGRGTENVMVRGVSNDRHDLIGYLSRKGEIGIVTDSDCEEQLRQTCLQNPFVNCEF